MKFTLILGCCTAFSLLTACTTTSTTTAMQRDAYLEQFIGQSSQTIQAKLNLSSIGYQQVLLPTVDDQTLTYTVIRPVTIPMPMAQNPADIDSGSVPIQIPPRAQSYDVNLQCKIIYRLEHNIAKSVYYTGRTC
ncbi:hypothetical protein [Acinetobacter sp.]|jgi:hypothetical protein|uniref:hypothetical protein n=1 Tax=Acinetobacter sp. TaxID=472 RepID=UPI0026490896|nr:hypothetical protein [Acinetobacter sp.]MDN5511088.1 hypothetical protein [Acinetobacter sp.]MDN5524022.1 hypothetical protein [Acinetobacter sp.]